MFRRRTPSEPTASEQTAVPADTQSKGTPSKGRPTPKRREAEKRRRQPITAPKSRREAYRRVRQRNAQDRERTSQDRARARAGMARGEDKYLPKRDQGPVRRLARDYVDSRRTIGSYLMWVLLASLLLNVVPIVILRVLSFFVPPLLLVIVAVEGVLISRRVSRLAAERFPDEERRGLGFYAAMRAMQIRRWRIPQPQVKLGDDIGA